MLSVRNFILIIKNPQTKYVIIKQFEQHEENYERLGLYYDFKSYMVKCIY